jgi:hypothetical protein
MAVHSQLVKTPARVALQQRRSQPSLTLNAVRGLAVGNEAWTRSDSQSEIG